MKIFHVIEAYECSTTITEDIVKVIEAIQDGIDSDVMIEVWEYGRRLFSTKTYKEEDYYFDDIYVELMNFINKKEGD